MSVVEASIFFGEAAGIFISTLTGIGLKTLAVVGIFFIARHLQYKLFHLHYFIIWGANYIISIVVQCVCLLWFQWFFFPACWDFCSVRLTYRARVDSDNHKKAILPLIFRHMGFLICLSLAWFSPLCLPCKIQCKLHGLEDKSKKMGSYVCCRLPLHACARFEWHSSSREEENSNSVWYPFCFCLPR